MERPYLHRSCWGMQGTDGLPGSLCSLAGGAVAGYTLTPCSADLDLHCTPITAGKLVGTGLGYCNFSSPVDSVSCPLPSHCNPFVLHACKWAGTLPTGVGCMSGEGPSSGSEPA